MGPLSLTHPALPSLFLFPICNPFTMLYQTISATAIGLSSAATPMKRFDIQTLTSFSLDGRSIKDWSNKRFFFFSRSCPPLNVFILYHSAQLDAARTLFWLYKHLLFQRPSTLIFLPYTHTHTHNTLYYFYWFVYCFTPTVRSLVPLCFLICK